MSSSEVTTRVRAVAIIETRVVAVGIVEAIGVAGAVGVVVKMSRVA
jgi:hypothetical protein